MSMEKQAMGDEFEQGFKAGLEAAAQWLDAVPTDIYPDDVFLPIDDCMKAKDGVAADVFRTIAPCWARAVRSIEWGAGDA